jgi:hypothetical protein
MTGFAAWLGLASVPIAAQAHYSFAMFDRAQAIAVTATLKKGELANPHSWYWVLVPDGKGGGAMRRGRRRPAPQRRQVPRGAVPGTEVNPVVHPTGTDYRDGRPGGEFIRLTTLDSNVKYQETFQAGGAPLAPPK